MLGCGLSGSSPYSSTRPTPVLHSLSCKIRVSAARTLNSAGAHVRPGATEFSAARRRRRDPACLLPSKRRAPLRHGRADGGSSRGFDGRGRIGRQDLRHRSNHLPLLSWRKHRAADARLCAGGCGRGIAATGDRCSAVPARRSGPSLRPQRHPRRTRPSGNILENPLEKMPRFAGEVLRPQSALKHVAMLHREGALHAKVAFSTLPHSLNRRWLSTLTKAWRPLVSSLDFTEVLSCDVFLHCLR